MQFRASIYVVLGAVCALFGCNSGPSVSLGLKHSYTDAEIAQGEQDRKDFLEMSASQLPVSNEWIKILNFQLGAKNWVPTVGAVYVKDRTDMGRPKKLVGTSVSPSEHVICYDMVMYRAIRKEHPNLAEDLRLYIASRALARDVQCTLYNDYKSMDLSRTSKNKDLVEAFENQTDYLVGVSWKHDDKLKLSRDRLTLIMTAIQDYLDKNVEDPKDNEGVQFATGSGNIQQRVDWIVKGYESGKVHAHDDEFANLAKHKA